MLRTTGRGQAVREEFESLLAQQRLSVPTVETGDRVAQSLFICKSASGAALGFAVNNSGLIVCPSAVGSVQTVVHVASRARHKPEYVERRNLLSALRVERRTNGLPPSYREYPNFEEPLFSYNLDGARVQLSVDGIALHALMESGTETLVIKDAFSAHFDPAERLIGGPVLNEADEVMGIAVGASRSGWLIVQPWSTVEKCIEMEIGTKPRSASRP